MQVKHDLLPGDDASAGAARHLVTRLWQKSHAWVMRLDLRWGVGRVMADRTEGVWAVDRQ